MYIKEGAHNITSYNNNILTMASEENMSNNSTDSSFVPVESHTTDAIQAINEAKEFNKDILKYIEKTTSSGIGNDYHILSVFGSQSTGKSTLLNNLFNTNFDVMDERRRQQTTKGIWIAHSPLVSTSEKSRHDTTESIFVMDVEGTDGRERGEDQDFERKAALFALSTSEVLIVNLWENQIGLYQGANLGLLKTVFEVNLSLFGKTKLEKNEHKVLLLFVIRDYVGVTPLDNLASTLTEDLLNMWNSLSIPPELSHVKFEDFFDVAFHTVSHKILQADKFTADLRLLGDKIMDSENEKYLFKPYYHHNIPIDGWTIYAQNCWDQINNNKDLDLPTQQVLVAKFKCDEFMNSTYDEFSRVFEEHFTDEDVSSDTDFAGMGALALSLLEKAIKKYDSAASRYNQSVYSQRKDLLVEKLHGKYRKFFDLVTHHLIERIISDFNVALASIKKNLSDKSFYEEVSQLRNEKTDYFLQTIQLFSLKDDQGEVAHKEKLSSELESAIEKQKSIRLNSILVKSLKKLNAVLCRVMVEEISDPTEKTWDNVISNFKKNVLETFLKYRKEDGKYDFGLGTSNESNNLVIECFNFRSWCSLHEVIHRYISKDSVLNQLKERFDDKFRYDAEGLPKLYDNAIDLERSFHEAKDHALKALPILSLATLSNGSEILPDYNIFDKHLIKKFSGASVTTPEEEEIDIESDSDDSIDAPCFAQILSEEDKAYINSKFKAETDAKFVETKRSLIQQVTHIPYYIYLIILVLGWNEFMAVLRNPFFFSLLLILGTSALVLYHLNLLTPALLVARRLFDELVVIVKQKLKEFVIDDSDLHSHNFSKMLQKSSSPPSDPD